MILYQLWKNFLSSLTIFLIILLFGCAPLISFPPAKPFSQQESDRLISNLHDQEKKVSSFQGIGKLLLKRGEEEIEANLFTIGKRPYKVRLEIAHPWGKPLLYVVADEKNVSALSFAERKLFRGPSGSFNIQQFFPCGFDMDLAWTIFTGSVPILSTAERVMSLKPYEISLYDKQGEVTKTIRFSSRDLLPRSIYFPKKGFTIFFSEFEKKDAGFYPLSIKVLKEKEDQLVVIRYKSLQLNKAVPEEIFQLHSPPGFEIVNLYNR